MKLLLYLVLLQNTCIFVHGINSVKKNITNVTETR